MKAQIRKSERGQALAETAVFAILAAMMAFALLSFIPVHRARTAATSAAYACAQFLSQSPDPAKAKAAAQAVAEQTLKAAWSGAGSAGYQVRVSPPSGRGGMGTCTVRYHAPVMFTGLLGGAKSGWSQESFTSRSETYKATWGGGP